MDFLGLKNANFKRSVILILIGVAINCILFFGCSMFLKLPVWFDTTGIAVVAIMGGFIPAAIVGVINSIITSFVFGFETFLFVFVCLATAATFAFFASRKKVKGIVSVSGICFIHMFVRMISIMIVTVVIDAPLVNFYEIIGYNAAISEGFSKLGAHFYALTYINVIEAVGMTLLVYFVHAGLCKIAKLK